MFNTKLTFMKHFTKFALLLVLGMGLAHTALAQIVGGGIKDAQGQPVIGASVTVDGTTLGTTSDVGGNFQLNVPDAKNAVLTVSFIGYATQSVPVNGRSQLDIVLAEDAQTLDDVVVIGYQTVKRKDLTGSVASVTGKDVSAMPVSNVAQALQGKLPGVNVTTQDGRPDATVSIRVRGGGSISQSNEPLVLIDGIPGTISDVPSDQVASIDVLKDASSTAIYGARGANGVILITTKGAKEGRVNVSYNGYVKVNTASDYYDALDPYDYLVSSWTRAQSIVGNASAEPIERLYGIGRFATNENGGIEAYKNVKAYNMQKEVYKSSISHNHDVSVSGGTDRTKVLFSFGYMDEQGMKLNSYLRRANVSLKLNQKITKNLDFALDTRYVQRQAMGNEGTTNGSGSLLSYAYRFRPIATSDIRGDRTAMNGTNIDTYGKFSQVDEYSPYARILDYEPETNRQHLLGTATVNWKIVKGLTYHTDFTLFRTWNQNYTWEGAIAKEYLKNGEKTYAGDATIAKNDSWGMRWTNTLNYDVTFGDAHRLNVLVGHEVSNSGGTSLSVTGSKYPANFTKENAFAMLNQYAADGGSGSFSSGKTMPERIVSLFARANYTLLDRYLFTFTFRADGSSKFAPSNRWGYFPAAAFAWRLSEENFLKNTDWLDNLKLRLSYGQVGNDGIDSNLWAQNWKAVTDSRYQYHMNETTQPGYEFSSSSMPNADLKWETTVTRNLGIDFGFWKNRLTGSVDVYWNTTKDLLMVTAIPGITGFTQTYANVGQTSNKGVEIALQGVIFENRNWNISAGFNINFNKNNVDKLSDSVSGLYGTQWGSSMTNPQQDYLLRVDSPVGLVRGWVYDGFYTVDDFTYENGVYTLKPGVVDIAEGQIMKTLHGIPRGARPKGQTAYPGMARFKDIDGDGKAGEADLTVIGDMTPKHTGGFNLNATFKGIDFGAYFNWSYGNKIYNAHKLASLYNNKDGAVFENKLAITKNQFRIFDVSNDQITQLTTPDALRAANTAASLPYAYNEEPIVSSLGIESGSFLRLNTLTLGYTLPKTITKKFGVSNLRVYASIYNVCTITGYSGLDPEVSTNTSQNKQVYPTLGLDWGAYPRPRSYVVGLNVSF